MIGQYAIGVAEIAGAATTSVGAPPPIGVGALVSQTLIQWDDLPTLIRQTLIQWNEPLVMDWLVQWALEDPFIWTVTLNWGDLTTILKTNAIQWEIHSPVVNTATILWSMYDDATAPIVNSKVVSWNDVYTPQSMDTYNYVRSSILYDSGAEAPLNQQWYYIVTSINVSGNVDTYTWDISVDMPSTPRSDALVGRIIEGDNPRMVIAFDAPLVTNPLDLNKIRIEDGGGYYAGPGAITLTWMAEQATTSYNTEGKTHSIKGRSNTARFGNVYGADIEDSVTGETVAAVLANIQTTLFGTDQSAPSISWSAETWGPVEIDAEDGVSAIDLITELAEIVGARRTPSVDGDTIFVAPRYPANPSTTYNLMEATELSLSHNVGANYDYVEMFPGVLSDSDATIATESEQCGLNITFRSKPYVTDVYHHDSNDLHVVAYLGTDTTEETVNVEILYGAAKIDKDEVGFVSFEWKDDYEGSDTIRVDPDGTIRTIKRTEDDEDVIDPETGDAATGRQFGLLELTYVYKIHKWRVTGPRDTEALFVVSDKELVLEP
jgi:hypothetical protein